MSSETLSTRNLHRVFLCSAFRWYLDAISGEQNLLSSARPEFLLCSLRFAAGQSLKVKELSVHSARCCSGAKL